MLVLTSGYEGEYEHILLPPKINVTHKPENPWYVGKFAEPEKGEMPELQAVVIPRNVRLMNV